MRLGQYSVKLAAAVSLFGALVQFGAFMISQQTGFIVLYELGGIFTAMTCGLVPALAVSTLVGFAGVGIAGNSLFFCVVSYMMVFLGYLIAKRQLHQTWWTFILMVLLLGVTSGALDSVLQYYLLGGGIGFQSVTSILAAVAPGTEQSMPVLVAADILINIIDKALTLGIIYLVERALPERVTKTLPVAQFFNKSVRFFSSDRMDVHRARSKTVRWLRLDAKIVTLCAVVAVASAFLLYFLTSNVYREKSFENNAVVAESYMAASSGLVTGYDISAFLTDEGGETPEYQSMVKRLDEFYAQSADVIKFIYVYQFSADEAGTPMFRVIYDSDQVDGDPFGYKFYLDEDYYEESRSSLFEMSNLQNVGPFVSDGQWGWLMSMYQPVLDKDGNKVACIGIDLDMNEVMSGIYTLNVEIFCIEFLIFSLLISITYSLLQGMVLTPIRKLEALTLDFAASRSAGTDSQYLVDKSTPIQTGDEFEILYNAIVETEEIVVADMKRMDEYNAVIKMMAYRDELTGVKNSAAYALKVEELDEQIKGGSAEFGIVMIDMNDLKSINDKFGHEKGNIAIKKMCNVVCTTFKRSPVYRIGGDEFVVVLSGADYQNLSELRAVLREYESPRETTSADPWNQVSLAFGTAVFDPAKDGSFAEVFNRADQSMYGSKRSIKQESGQEAR